MEKYSYNTYMKTLDYRYKNDMKKKTRPDTQLLKLRAGGQRLYLRSLDNLGRSSGVKK